MALNIMKKYVKFEKDFLREYIKITFFKKYDRKLVDFFLDEYFKVRYYDFLEKNISVNITNYIENQFKDQEFDDNRVRIFKEFLPIVYRIDGVIKNSSILDIVTRTEKFRYSKLGIEETNSQEFIKILKERKKRIGVFYNRFVTNDFEIKLAKTNVKKINYVGIVSKIKFDDLYSEKAIETVFNTGLVAENKLFILYYLVTLMVLQDVIALEYDKYYIVEFKSTLLDKDDKRERLLNILNDECLKERVILIVDKEDYDLYKDIIDGYINLGFKWAIKISKQNQIDFVNGVFGKLFNYIVLDDSNYIEDIIDKEKVVIVR